MICGWVVWGTKVLIVQVFINFIAIEFVVFGCLVWRMNSPVAMHGVVVYLGRAAGHIAAKTSANTRGNR
jgi:hypothetical protein